MIFINQNLKLSTKGNCWFVGSIGCLIQNYSVLIHVVPLDNTFEDSKYTGIFEFLFY